MGVRSQTALHYNSQERRTPWMKWLDSFMFQGPPTLVQDNRNPMDGWASSAAVLQARDAGGAASSAKSAELTHRNG